MGEVEEDDGDKKPSAQPSPEDHSQEEETRKKVKCCSVCGVIASCTTTLKRCGGCDVVYYCSVKCQKRDYKSHKTECAVLKANKMRDKGKRRREVVVDVC